MNKLTTALLVAVVALCAGCATLGYELHKANADNVSREIFDLQVRLDKMQLSDVYENQERFRDKIKELEAK